MCMLGPVFGCQEGMLSCWWFGECFEVKLKIKMDRAGGIPCRGM